MAIKLFLTGLVLALLMGIPENVYSQNHLIELNVKGSAILAPLLQFEDERAGSRDFFSAGYHMEALYFIKDYAGAGLFYSRDFGSIASDLDLGGSSYGTYPESVDGDVSYLTYGISAQITTHRQRKFRVYGVIRTFKIEVVDKYSGFSIGRSGIGYSAGFGVAIKVTKWMSFNLLEVNYIGLSKKLDYKEEKGLAGAMANSGFIFKILKKK